MEKDGGNHLHPHHWQQHVGQSHAVFGHSGKFRIGREGFDQYARHELEGYKSDRNDQGRDTDRQQEGVLHPFVFLSPVVVADDRLHALTDTQYEHNDQNTETVDDAESAYGQIAPFAD